MQIKTWWIVILLILFAPMGLIEVLSFSFSAFETVTRHVIETILTFLWVIFSFIYITVLVIDSEKMFSSVIEIPFNIKLNTTPKETNK